RVADVLDADRALVVPKVAGVPCSRLFGDELTHLSITIDDVLDALSRIVLQRRDARVPAAFGVVDDDVLHRVAVAAGRALVRAARREPLCPGVLRSGERVELR